ncbi:MAG TPA: DNA polymerase III subunit alpha [Egibacteraceae bacterium]|nr:DNA polymerase III subunit alpha [Egibacteraceae bacterium]
MDPARMTYVELSLRTNYSVLEGASHPEELIGKAAAMGYAALGITDRDNLYGVIPFAQECHRLGIRPITGVDLTVGDAPAAAPRHRLTLLAKDRQGYANLCRMISLASGHAEASQADRERRRRDPCLARARLASHAEGLICLTGGRDSEVTALLEAGDRRGAEETLRRLAGEFGAENVYLQLTHNLVLGDRARNRALARLAGRAGAGIVATGDVWYHERSRHRLHDALVAIRHRTTLESSHRLRKPNSEFFLRAPAEQARRFAEWPEAVGATAEIAERCSFDPTEDLGYRLPTPPVPEGHSPDTWLAALCAQAMEAKYAPEEQAAARERLDEELRLIAHHGLAGFFLVYHEVLELAVQVAAEVRGDSPRGRVKMSPGRGRGSSVGSIVCYLIGLSHIDPIRNNLFLGRFLNEELTSLPDIDLDFPREIRERLFERVYEHWGADRAAIVAIFPRFRARSAIRDMGKALGLPATELDRLAKLSEGYGSSRHLREEMLRAPQFAPLVDAPGWRELIELAYEVADFPRHLSQHVGGMVIASEPLIDCVPIVPAAWPGRYLCHWDKDAVDDARMVKIDFLALGMLSLVEECLDLVYDQHGDQVDLSRIDFDDAAVYDRICRGDTVGVFQIESRAQAGMLPRTRPRNLDDLAAQVAIVRPGPIMGKAVHPFVQRRQHPELIAMPHECVREALEETLGVVLYQEQVTQVAMAMGGFTAGEAESFRRAMSRRSSEHALAGYEQQFMVGAAQRGVSREVAAEMFEALAGFAYFGFPKSHATAFGLLAYQSAWLKEHYPAEFYCALYNNWPMGFYPPHVLTNDARRHGVEILRPDIYASAAKCTVEDGAVRLGLAQVRGLGEGAAKAVVDERDRRGMFRSLWDVVQRTGLDREVTENAIQVGVFDSFGLGRRELLWQLGLFGLGPGRVRMNAPRQLRLALPTDQDEVPLKDFSPYERMAADYQILSLSPDAHPMRFLRMDLDARVRSTRQLLEARPGSVVETAGLVVCRQQPSTASGTIFLLLEDEDGMANVMVSPWLYQANRMAVRTSAFLRVSGVIDAHSGDVPMMRARSIHPLRTAALSTPAGKSWG